VCGINTCRAAFILEMHSASKVTQNVRHSGNITDAREVADKSGSSSREQRAIQAGTSASEAALSIMARPALETRPETPMASQIPVSPAAIVGVAQPGGLVEVAPSLAYLKRVFVNVAFLGDASGWLLVDAAIPGSRARIEAAARARFGDAPPKAILLTHGHFDHVGSLQSLLEHWDVPVYAHPEEHPFLNGTRSYPPAQPRLTDGLMSLSSPLFPRKPIDLGPRLRALPVDGGIPDLPGWRWIATPGHAPGHVSFWNEEERLLAAGDAFVTTQQESLLAALSQRAEMHGPPRYFTPDWTAAEASVKLLSELEPERAVTGHGPALGGAELRTALNRLARDFRAIAVPH